MEGHQQQSLISPTSFTRTDTSLACLNDGVYDEPTDSVGIVRISFSIFFFLHYFLCLRKLFISLFKFLLDSCAEYLYMVYSIAHCIFPLYSAESNI
jgi:hypothetical protein